MSPSKKHETSSVNEDEIISTSIPVKLLEYIIWKCNACDEGFHNRQKCYRHSISMHYCYACNGFKTGDLNEHVQTHSPHERQSHEIQKQNKELEYLKLDEERLKKHTVEELFVKNFLKPKRLNEYQLPTDELDIEYIFDEYRTDIGDQETLYFFTERFKFLEHTHISTLFGCDIVCLLAHNLLKIDDAIDFINSKVEKCAAAIYYFYNNNLEIKPLWVSRHINNDYLIDLIKTKYNFTFLEIYEARNEHLKPEQENEYYLSVHNHFPDPYYDDDFEHAYEKFQRFYTERVDDYLKYPYFYDSDLDILYIYLFHHGKKTIAISKNECKKKFKRSLDQLYDDYMNAINERNEAQIVLDRVFNRRIELFNDSNRKEINEKIKTDGPDVYLKKLYQSEKYAKAKKRKSDNDLAVLYFLICNK